MNKGKKMKKLTSITALLVLTLSMSGCLFNTSSKSKKPERTGNAQITLNMGRVGVLAKTSAIELASLKIVLTAVGETAREKAFPLSGSEGNVGSAEFENLASLKNWTLSAESRDEKGVVIHSGSTSFYVKPEETTAVSLMMNAAYSMIRAEFLDVPDSVRKVEINIDGVVRDVSETEIAYLTGQNVQLAFDYLETGRKHEIVLNSHGTMWGKAYLLYTGKAVVETLPGKDYSYEVTLNWVGPEAPPKGRMTMEVALGGIGTTLIKAKYKKHKNKYPAENPK
jgi:hypothetical protein